MGARVAVDGDLVVADQVLAVIEVLERGADPIRDRIQAGELLRHAEHGGRIGEEDLTQQRPVLRVERPAVAGGQRDDVAFVEQCLQHVAAIVSGAHTSVHPPSTARF